jgi:YgiT-type zinc finger domain-containing protein
MNPEISQPAPADLCAQCHEGTYQSMTKDYTVELRDGDQCTIANLAQRKCNQCGHLVLPWPSVQRVDRAVADHTEPLTAEFLKQTRERLQPSMTLLAESLGLGSKTWMRWEKGEQNISRSMGYFVRAMAQFPEVYEWVADRAWRADESGLKTVKPSPIKDLERKILKTYLSPSKPNKRDEQEIKALDQFLADALNTSLEKTRPTRIHPRRGDIQHVDSRFAESMEVA